MVVVMALLRVLQRISQGLFQPQENRWLKAELKVRGYSASASREWSMNDKSASWARFSDMKKRYVEF